MIAKIEKKTYPATKCLTQYLKFVRMSIYVNAEPESQWDDWKDFSLFSQQARLSFPQNDRGKHLCRRRIHVRKAPLYTLDLGMEEESPKPRNERHI